MEKVRNFNLPVEKAIWWAWILFTSLYFLVSMFLPVIYTQTQQVALQGKYQEGQVSGYNTAFSLLGQALDAQVREGCKQALPVSVASGQTMGIVNVGCLQQPQAGAQNAPQAQTK